MNNSELELKTVDQLRALARERGIADVGGLRKAALIARIMHGNGGEKAAQSETRVAPQVAQEPQVAVAAAASEASAEQAPESATSLADAPTGDLGNAGVGRSAETVPAVRPRASSARRSPSARPTSSLGVDVGESRAVPVPGAHTPMETTRDESDDTPVAPAPPQLGLGRASAAETADARPAADDTPSERRQYRPAQNRGAGANARPGTEARPPEPLVAAHDRDVIESAEHDDDRAPLGALEPTTAVVMLPTAVGSDDAGSDTPTPPERPVGDDRSMQGSARPMAAPMAAGTPAVRPFERHRGRDRDRGRGGFDRGERGDRPDGMPGPRGQAIPGERLHGISNDRPQGQVGGYGYPPQPAPVRQGVLEIMDGGFGFLRLDRYWKLAPDDIYVAQAQIRRFGLRTGDVIIGQVRSPKDSENYASLIRIESVNGQDPETAKRRPVFDNLTALFPDRMFDLEMTDIQGVRELQQANLSNRVINLLAPIGRGQRGLIVSPPKAGKTMLLKGIAHAITRNQPDAYVMVALIGERPEEVTDWQKTVAGAEVISSTFDEQPESHTRVAEMCLERAKRVAELGKDVIILLDSITRLARAYNQCVPPSGRTLSGGMDPAALFPPKRFFGAARNLEEGGSLTIIATCLVETESRLDDLIYEEFKGTGNMELRLDRKLQEKRIFPAISVQGSSTRRDDLLLGEAVLRQAVMLRRIIASVGTTDAVERMIETMGKTETNREFLQAMSKVPA